MQTLLPRAEQIASLLKQRRETIAIAESSAGGLIAASMLSVPGASAYFIGGAVFYTRKSITEMLNISDDAFKGKRGLTEPTAQVIARGVLGRLGSTWGIAEIGASGPTGSRYGDPAGRSCIAVVGPIERAITIETGSSDRVANMRAFADAALKLFEECLRAKG
ncbi:MAG TPA: CinA family protein [Candidatus Binataceae bacterium]|nr:CinA family protein [Candidatus Binataceae bacterium]